MEDPQLMDTKLEITRQNALNWSQFISSFDVWDTLQPPLPALKPKFQHALVRNAIRLEPVGVEYNKVQKSEKAYAAYEKAEVALRRIHARKDKDDNPVSNKQGQYILENKAEFSIALRELQESAAYKEAYDLRTEYLQELITIDVYKVHRKYAPLYGIPPVSGGRFLEYFVYGEIPDDVVDTLEGVAAAIADKEG